MAESQQHMTIQEITDALKPKNNTNLPTSISLPYADGKGVDKVEVKYIDPKGDLASLMEKNGIKLTENSFTLGGLPMEPEGDNQYMEFSANPDGSIKLTVKENPGREGNSVDIGGTITNYTIKNGAITGQQLEAKMRYNPLTTTRLINR